MNPVSQSIRFGWIAFGLTLFMANLAMSENDTLKLPPPNKTGEMTLEELLLRRRSRREFSDKQLSREQISQLLWAAQGITGESHGVKLRTAPSAGALYPIEVYVLTADGLYVYQPHVHSLTLLNQMDLRERLASAALGQRWVAEAPLSLVLSAVHERVTRKYGQRGIRYSLIEAGHIAQNVHLQAVALGLGSVPIGAFSDQEVSAVLDLPDNQQPLYIIPIGYLR